MLDSAHCVPNLPLQNLMFTPQHCLLGTRGDIIVNAAALIVQSNAAKEGLRRRLLH